MQSNGPDKLGYRHAAGYENLSGRQLEGRQMASSKLVNPRRIFVCGEITFPSDLGCSAMKHV